MCDPLATVGPYHLEIEVNALGIFKVLISKKPYKKTKNSNKIIVQLERAVLRYFQGDPAAFTEIPLLLSGTPFQQKVWRAVQKIPYGETRTYGQIATSIGKPKAVRAVGTVIGKNPVCIVIPCHRVVPKSGGIGNYAYGKAMKQWLLDHEAGRNVEQ